VSRGFGRAQRAVLATLAEGRPFTAAEIADRHGLHIESIRRAMRTLARSGVIRTNRRERPRVGMDNDQLRNEMFGRPRTRNSEGVAYYGHELVGWLNSTLTRSR
jgi:predicted ArsR family transcriptional regulator